MFAWIVSFYRKTITLVQKDTLLGCQIVMITEAKPVIPIKAAKARVKVQKYSDDEIIFYIHK